MRWGGGSVRWGECGGERGLGKAEGLEVVWEGMLSAVLDEVEGSSSLTMLVLYEWMSKELLAGSLTKLASDLYNKGLGEDGGMVLGRLLGRSASTLTYLDLT